LARRAKTAPGIVPHRSIADGFYFLQFGLLSLAPPIAGFSCTTFP
jgi:hypothetical protein